MRHFVCLLLFCACLTMPLYGKSSKEKFTKLRKNGDRFFSEKLFFQAAQAFREYRKLAKNNVFVYTDATYRLAKALLKAGYFEETQTVFQEYENYLKSKKVSLPTKIKNKILFLKAQTFYRLRKPEKAIEILEKLLATLPDSVQNNKLKSQFMLSLARAYLETAYENPSKKLKYLKNAEKTFNNIILNLITNQEMSAAKLGIIEIEIYRKQEKKALSQLYEFQKTKKNWGLLQYIIILAEVRTNQIEKAYKTWQNNQALLKGNTHLRITQLLIELAQALYLRKKHLKAFKLLDFCDSIAFGKYSRQLVYFARIKINLNIKNTRQAYIHYQKFLEAFPGENIPAKLTFRLANLYLNTEIHDAALKLYLKIPDNETTTSSLIYKKYMKAGICLTYLKRNPEAIKSYLKAEMYTTSKEKKAEALFAAGIIDNNIKILKKALQLGETSLSSQILYSLADAEMIHKKFFNAANHYRNFLKLYPNAKTSIKQTILLKQGDAFLKAKMFKEAILSFQYYAQIYKNDKKTANVLFKAYVITQKNLNSPEKSLKILSDIIANYKDIFPNIYSKSLYERALIFYTLNHKAEAIHDWETFLKYNKKSHHPLTPNVYMWLATINASGKNKNLTNALLFYNSLIVEYPRSSLINQAIYNYAEIHFKEKTILSLRKAISFIKNNLKKVSLTEKNQSQIYNLLIKCRLNLAIQLPFNKRQTELKLCQKDVKNILTKYPLNEMISIQKADVAFCILTGILANQTNIEIKQKFNRKAMNQFVQEFIAITKNKYFSEKTQIKIHYRIARILEILGEEKNALKEFLIVFYALSFRPESLREDEKSLFLQAGRKSTQILEKRNKLKLAFRIYKRLASSKIPEAASYKLKMSKIQSELYTKPLEFPE